MALVYIYIYLHISIWPQYISICICTFLFVSTYIYVHLCICIYLYVSIHIYIHLYISVYKYMCIYTNIYIYISAYIYMFLRISTYIYIYLHKSICFYTYLHTSIHIHTHLHMSINKCVHIQTYISIYACIFSCACGRGCPHCRPQTHKNIDPYRCIYTSQTQIKTHENINLYNYTYMHAPPHISTKRHLRIEDLSCAGTHSFANIDTVQIAIFAPLYDHMCFYVVEHVLGCVFSCFRLFYYTFHHCRPTVRKYVFLCVGTCSHMCLLLFVTLILYTSPLSPHFVNVSTLIY